MNGAPDRLGRPWRKGPAFAPFPLYTAIGMSSRMQET